MAKIPAAQTRLFKGIFICKVCSTKKRADARKILEGKVKCRKCGAKAFRPLRKRWAFFERNLGKKKIRDWENKK